MTQGADHVVGGSCYPQAALGPGWVLSSGVPLPLRPGRIILGGEGFLSLWPPSGLCRRTTQVLFSENQPRTASAIPPAVQ